MSHGITNNDSLISVRERPWHGLGVVLDEPPTGLDDALEKSGLTWEVEPEPIYVHGQDNDGMRPIDGHVANVRSDTGEVLGIVSERYRVVSNREAFAFIGALIGSELCFETAGSLHGGRRVFVMCRLPDWIEVAGERVDQFLGLTTSHDGSAAAQAAVSPVRWVCQNTLNYGLRTAIRKATIRHRGDISTKLHEARRVLELTVAFYAQFKALGDRLASQTISERALRAALEALYPGGTTDSARRNAMATREAVMGLFTSGETVGNAPGSRWAALNAIVEYQDHYRPLRGSTERFERILDDEAFKTRALAAVLDA